MGLGLERLERPSRYDGGRGHAPRHDSPAGPAAPHSIGATKTFTSNAPILHKFNVDRSGGTTEYFFSELVSNKTGVDWLDFHFELIGLNGGLDFDTDGSPETSKDSGPQFGRLGRPQKQFQQTEPSAWLHRLEWRPSQKRRLRLLHVLD
jgi:hypothetical protein